ncbi:TetR family transcriptional regulator [Nakamurella flavida]
MQRLQQAALELFSAQGFDRTTAAEIAAAAGLTERTFFRHFGDKREVLFMGQEDFVGAFLAGLDAAAPDAAPLDVVAACLTSAAGWFPAERRPYARLRQTVIDATPALVERERHKLAGVAVELARALRERDIPEPAATLAAESGITVFTVAFAQWTTTDDDRSLGVVCAEMLDALRSLDRPR